MININKKDYELMCTDGFDTSSLEQEIIVYCDIYHGHYSNFINNEEGLERIIKDEIKNGSINWDDIYSSVDEHNEELINKIAEASVVSELIKENRLSVPEDEYEEMMNTEIMSLEDYYFNCCGYTDNYAVLKYMDSHGMACIVSPNDFIYEQLCDRCCIDYSDCEELPIIASHAQQSMFDELYGSEDGALYKYGSYYLYKEIKVNANG